MTLIIIGEGVLKMAGAAVKILKEKVPFRAAAPVKLRLRSFTSHISHRIRQESSPFPNPRLAGVCLGWFLQWACP